MDLGLREALGGKKFSFVINSNVPLEGNYYSIDMFIMVLDNYLNTKPLMSSFLCGCIFVYKYM